MPALPDAQAQIISAIRRAVFARAIAIFARKPVFLAIARTVFVHAIAISTGVIAVLSVLLRDSDRIQTELERLEQA